MADFTAIAAVSRTLRRLLTDRMQTASVAVTLAPPDVTVAGVNGARVNLYLYQVIEHAQLKNQPLPGHEHPAAYGSPPLSLMLRYLMTSYARSDDQADSDILAQAVLGDAMLVLHDVGGRWDDLKLITNRVGAIGDPVLDVALQEEFERAKLALHPAPLDELTKIWSAMPQANFRRCAVYEASVVQLESRMPRRQAEPVQKRRLLVSVARAPTLLDAYLTPPPPPADHQRDQRVGIGDQVTLEHSPTTASKLYVRFGALEPIRVPLPSNGFIRLPIPDSQYPVDLDHPAARPIPPQAQLQPGPLEIVLLAVDPTQGVEGALDRGTPLVEDRALRSNSVLLQLVPTVGGSSPGFGDHSAILRLTGSRLWDPHLASEVVVGDVAVPVRPPGPGDPWAAPTSTQVEVPVSTVAAVLLSSPTPYTVAAQVNGARSRETAFAFRLDP